MKKIDIIEKEIEKSYTKTLKSACQRKILGIFHVAFVHLPSFSHLREVRYPKNSFFFEINY